ncbi:MAG: GPW/gp25 family protein [Saccharospirillum sp.]|nr:GPW/gp25 family protein [Saccharospirillum sp.]
MGQLRFLKRLQQWQQYEGSLPAQDDQSLIDSVLADVENLLNTIQGTALINERLGLSDVKKLFVSHGSLAQDVVTEEIRYNISQFEARIKRFTLEKDSAARTGQLGWVLHGEIPVRERSLAFQANLVLTADGRISLKARV